MRRTIMISVLLSTLYAVVLAQTPATQTGQQPAATGSVTGTVKIGTRAAKGITVGLARDMQNRPGGPVTSPGAPGAPPPPPPPAPYVRTVTDDGGKFVFNNVAAGDYRVSAIAESYVLVDSSVAQYGVPVSVTEGQASTTSELVIAKGGVITGKITDSDGRPMIAERVTVSEIDSSGRVRNVPNRGSLETDDRGVYRVYGLMEGKYTISAGSGESGFGPFRRARYARTWYPNVTEQTGATVVETAPGKVVENIDIKLGDPLPTYSVQGRTIDAATGKPVPGVSVMATRMRQMPANRPGMPANVPGEFAGGPAGDQPGMSDEQGVFRISGLTSGSYSVNTMPGGRGGGLANDYYGDGATFQVSESDVTGVDVKLHLGVTITGILRVEGIADGPAIARLLSQTNINANVRPEQQGQPSPGGNRSGRFSSSQVNADGSFRLGGLEPGRTSFNVNSRGIRLGVVKIERNGAAVPEIQTSSGEQVLNLVITVREANSIIRGRVIASGGGAIGANYQVRITARSLDGNFTNGSGADATGNFEIDGLMPGSYEVIARATPRFPNAGAGRGPGGPGGPGGGPPGVRPGGQGGAGRPVVRIPEAKQLVTVTPGNVATVTISIDLSQSQ